jgi:hypothetical protein
MKNTLYKPLYPLWNAFLSIFVTGKSNYQMKKNIVLFIISSVVIATLSRLLPHPLNIAPLIGITLFSAAYLPKKWMGFVLPLFCWMLSDVFVNIFVENPIHGRFGYFTSYTALGVYSSLFIIFLLGSWLRSGVRLPKLVAITLSSSLLFYFITNSFSFFEGYYGSGLSGYVTCLAAGLPFYKSDYGTLFGSFFLNGIMGDLFYTSVLFGSYYLVNRRSLKPAFA